MPIAVFSHSSVQTQFKQQEQELNRGVVGGADIKILHDSMRWVKSW